MPRTLIRKNPSNFKTLPLHVEATPEGLSYQSVGMPLNFAQTLQRRKPVEVSDPERFALALRQHRTILDAIIARDASAASDAMSVVIFEGTRWTSMELQSAPSIAVTLKLFGR